MEAAEHQRGHLLHRAVGESTRAAEDPLSGSGPITMCSCSSASARATTNTTRLVRLPLCPWWGQDGAM